MKLSKALSFSLGAACCWAVSIVLTRIVLHAGENPYNLTFWTTVGASPYWLPLLLKEQKHLLRLKQKDWSVLISMALVSSVAVSFAEVFALANSPAVNFAFLIRTVTVFIIILAAIFLHEPLSTKKLILVVTVLFGSYLLTTNGKLLHITVGDGYTLLEAVLIAIGNGILIKMTTNRMSPNAGAVGKYFIALIPIILIAMANTPIRLPHAPLTVIGITIVDLGLSMFMFHAFRYATASFVTMIMSFTPVIVSLMSIPLLGESLSPTQLIGGGCIVLSGILVNKFNI